MKKILLLLTAVVAISFASCGNKSNSPQATDSAATDTAAITAGTQKTIENLTGALSQCIQNKDTKGVIVSLANLETIYKNLVDSGKVEEAKTYGSAIKEFINNNAESLKNIASGNTTIASLVSGIQNLPTTAATTAEEAKAAVSSDVVSLASDAIAKGTTTVATAEAAADAIKNAPETVTKAATTIASSAAEGAKTAVENKVNEKVTETQTKANDAINNAANKANQKVNDATNKALKDLGL